MVTFYCFYLNEVPTIKIALVFRRKRLYTFILKSFKFHCNKIKIFYTVWIKPI